MPLVIPIELEYLIPIAYAIGGQIARIALGLIKAYKDNVEIEWSYTFKTLVEAVIVGFIASMFTSDPNLLFVSGFAGTDALESLIAVAREK